MDHVFFVHIYDSLFIPETFTEKSTSEKYTFQ